MNICMIGAGYVGLVSAACFSEFGWKVACIDKDALRVESLNRGEVPIYEPGLDDLLKRNIEGGRCNICKGASPNNKDGRTVVTYHFLGNRNPTRAICAWVGLTAQGCCE